MNIPLCGLRWCPSQPRLAVHRIPLLEWVRKVEVDAGVRDGVTTEERERIKALEREVKELRRANEILKLASAFLPRRSSTAASNPESFCRSTSACPWSRADLQGIADCPVSLLATCC